MSCNFNEKLSLNVLWLESRGKIPVSLFFLYLIIILNILCFQQRILLLLLLLLLLLPSPPSLACCRKLSSMVAAWSTLIFSVFWLRVSDRKQTNKQTHQQQLVMNSWTKVAPTSVIVLVSHCFF